MRLTVGKGIDNYIESLEKLNLSTDETIKKAVYEGAGMIADAIKAKIQSMPVQDKRQQYVTGIRSIQKKGLEIGLGISRFKNDDGYINVKIGFDGYNRMVSKKYPKGQPNAMIARTFEGGNSFTKKIPFVSPAVRATREAAERKMAEIIDREIEAKI